MQSEIEDHQLKTELERFDNRINVSFFACITRHAHQGSVKVTLEKEDSKLTYNDRSM